MPLTDKVAIVTGAANGIGRAIASEFARANAKVIIADRDEAGGQSLYEELKKEGREVEFIHCDISERLDVLNLMAATLEAYNEVNIVVNAAAIKDDTPFLELSDSQFESVLNVNLKGAFMLGKAAAQQMATQIEAGGEPGVILFITSIHTVLAEPNAVAYSVANGGIGQLTKAMSQALASLGIRVNAIAHSNIWGQELEESIGSDALKDKHLERVPLGRFGDPSEIAPIASFLVSKAASYITGQSIYADGGALSVLSSIKHSFKSKEEEN